MQAADVIRIVESTIADKNLGWLASMKSLLETSLTDLKRSHADTADSQLKEIKKLKFEFFMKTNGATRYRAKPSHSKLASIIILNNLLTNWNLNRAENTNWFLSIFCLWKKKDALWFGETYGLLSESLMLPDKTGMVHEINLNDSNR